MKLSPQLGSFFIAVHDQLARPNKAGQWGQDETYYWFWDEAGVRHQASKEALAIGRIVNVGVSLEICGFRNEKGAPISA